MIRLSLMPRNTPFTRARVEHLVSVTGRFKARLMILSGSRTINAKSMLGLLSLGFVDENVTIQCDGPDEAAAAEALKGLLLEE